MVSSDSYWSIELSQEAVDRLLDVARCPLATTAEVHALNGRTVLSNVHRNVQTLRDLGLIDHISWHSGETSRASARHFITAPGVALLSRRLGVTEAELLRKFPVSAEWQIWLLQRIEMVALVYSVAIQIAGTGTEALLPVRVQFPRAGPLDGIVSTSDGISYGIMRQGYGLSLSGFTRHLSRQSRNRLQPARVLVVAADGFDKPLALRRLRQHRATLSAVVATEDELLVSDADSPIWTLPNLGARTLSLRECLGVAADPWQRALRVRTAYVRAAFPLPLSEVEGRGIAELTGAQRRSLEDVFSWPLMDIHKLAELHGLPHSNEARVLRSLLNLNLVERIRVKGLPRGRFVLSDEWWRYLSIRDNFNLEARLERWSAGSAERMMGTILSKLIRERDHTEGVNALACRLVAAYGKDSRLLPAHRSIRIFPYRGRDFQVVPDVVATTSAPPGARTLFVEYEMRATSKRDLTMKLLPWLRYFDTRFPFEDFSGVPQLLFILESEKTEARFHDIAVARCNMSGISLPLFTSTRELIDECDSLTDRLWCALGRAESGRSELL